MPRQREIPPEVIESLRMRIAYERNMLRTQLATKVPRQRKRANTRDRLRQVFKAWQDLVPD